MTLKNRKKKDILSAESITFLLEEADNNPNLDQWDKNFIESIKEQIKIKEYLTSKQEIRLYFVANRRHIRWQKNN